MPTTRTDPALRRQKLLARLAEKGVQGLLVTGPENRRYLTGFTGSTGWLVVSQQGLALVTDGRYWAQAQAECPDVPVVRFRRDLHQRLSQALAEGLRSLGWQGRLGCEAQHLTVAEFEDLKADLAGIELLPLKGLVEELRQVKSPEEIEAIRRAAGVAARAFHQALHIFQEGVREAELCAELEYRIQLCGARKPSFDTIVASGPNGAYPHAGVTDRRMQAGELVTIDFGALADGYCSDLTRTVWIGPLEGEQRRLYEAVRRAHRAGIEAIRPGKSGAEIDQVARSVLAEAGYAEAFSHGLGHGVGLAVHEGPGLRPGETTLLAPGMVLTVEPGVYIPGLGGCRVEDMVLVTQQGAEILTHVAYQEPGQEHPLGPLPG